MVPAGQHGAGRVVAAKPGGNKRTVDIRQVANGVMYVLSTGCQWRATPKDLLPKSTVHDYLERWTWDGTHWSACTMRST
jgi:transposase